MTIQTHISNSELLKIACQAADYSYSPYSSIRVGATVLTDKGKVFSASNVENASYGLTICAERAAIFKAVSEGERDFKSIAVFSKDIPGISPCGACLQVIREFGKDIEIILTSAKAASEIGKSNLEVKSINDLLPNPFEPNDIQARFINSNKAG